MYLKLNPLNGLRNHQLQGTEDILAGVLGVLEAENQVGVVVADYLVEDKTLA